MLTRAAMAEKLRRLVQSGQLEVHPSDGIDALHRLAQIAARDLSEARLAEAHLDALTILHEAGVTARPGALYGVWASESPNHTITVEVDRAGRRYLVGSKGFCTGAGIVDRALVTARSDGHVVLADVDVADLRVAFDASSWKVLAFADTSTASASFDHVELAGNAEVGGNDWYLDRTGFWLGALAPAACWAGGALGLIEHCTAIASGSSPTPHRDAHLGMLDVLRWEIESSLTCAAGGRQAATSDRNAATRLAHRFRSSIERAADLVIHHAVRCHGPRLLANDEWAATRIAELQLYIRQHHGEADHATLGELVRAGVRRPG